MIFLIKVKHDLNLTVPMWKVIALCFIKDSRRTAFFVLFFLIYSAVCIFFTCAAYQLSCSRVAHCSPVTSWHPTEIGQARPVEGDQVCWSASPDTTRWTHCSTPLLPFSLALLWEAPPSLSSISKQLHSWKLIAFMCGQMFVGGNDTFDTKAPRLVFSKVGVSKWSVICNIDIT